MTSTRERSRGAREKVSRMNSTWSSLIRPSLNVSERAVLIPSTASPGSSRNGHRVSSMKRSIAGQRRQEAAKHVVERHVVVARHAEHLVAGVAKPLEEVAGFRELLGPGALREVAADDDEVGLELVDARSTASTSRSSWAPKWRSERWTSRGHGRIERAAALSVQRRLRQKFRNSSSLTSTPKPSARFCSMKFGISARGDEVDVDVLVLVAAAFADLADAVRADQREAFRDHPRRRIEIRRAARSARR